jgi:hypothetical protein
VDGSPLRPADARPSQATPTIVASPSAVSLGGNGAEPDGTPLPHGVNEAGYYGTAAPDPANPEHAIALIAQEGDVPLRMAPATWWLELMWARDLGQSPPTATSLPQVVATGSI